MIEDPVNEVRKLNEAVAYFIVVEFDEAMRNVLGPVGDDIGLVVHRQEGDVVDRELERVIGHVVEDLDFPIELLVPQRHGKSAWRREVFAKEIVQNIRLKDACGMKEQEKLAERTRERGRGRTRTI